MPEHGHILLVEDDAHQREALASLLGEAGYEVTAAEDLAEARAALDGGDLDGVITDFNLPDGTGVEVIEAVRACPRPPAVLLVTAYGTIPLAVHAMRKGAVDVQMKPVDPVALLATLKRALHTRSLEVENVLLRERLGTQFDFPGFVAESPGMRHVLQQVRRVARSKATVLITGESGTGKEMIANLLHTRGGAPEQPFIAVNCAALPESLLESELFGCAKGAFTGATTDRIGRFEEAGGGSLFLDEIGEIPPNVQVKLLRVLQEREIVRLGENRPRRVDFRLIAATNVELEAEVRARRFREDLFYRLNVIRLHIPPLRDRPEDVRPLVARFLRASAKRNDLPLRPLGKGALEALIGHAFPGNVRQLQNIIEGAVLVAPGQQLELTDLSLGPSAPRPGAPSEGTLREVLAATESRLIRRALERAEGHMGLAAASLGIPDRTLRYKVRKLGLRRGDPTGDTH